MLTEVMMTMTTLMANRAPPPCLPTTTTISTASLSLEDITASNTSDRCTENPRSTTKSVLHKFPTSTLPTKPTAAVVDLLLDDDERYYDLTLLLPSPNVIGKHDSPTSLISSCCDKDDFNLLAACKQLQWQVQVLTVPPLTPCHPL